MKKYNKIFLGGTYNDTTWRDELIPVLTFDYFNPGVEDWTPKCIENEYMEKEICNIHLYVITSAMTGVFSIAECIDSIYQNKYTFLFIVPKGFEKSQLRSLNAVLSLVKKRGGFGKFIDDVKGINEFIGKTFGDKEMDKTKKYTIIYADPAWSYYNDKTVDVACTTVKGMRRPPYKVMCVADIKALPVKDISEENALLFIWTTDYHLAKSIEVIKEWGFEYKTVAFAWQKLTKANKPVCFMGAYTMKSGIELCLLGTKGKDAHKLVKKHNVRALISSQREAHSKKPDEARNKIVELCGDLSRIELFARKKYDGWDSWGDEL